MAAGFFFDWLDGGCQAWDNVYEARPEVIHHCDQEREEGFFELVAYLDQPFLGKIGGFIAFDNQLGSENVTNIETVYMRVYSPKDLAARKQELLDMRKIN